MRRILTAIFSFALAVAGCAAPVESTSAQAADVATSTQPIALFVPHAVDNSVPFKPDVGVADATHNFVAPFSISAGFNLVEADANVMSTSGAVCFFTLWQQNGFNAPNLIGVSSMTTMAVGSQFIFAGNLSVPINYEPFYLVLTNFNKTGQCSVEAARAMFTI